VDWNSYTDEELLNWNRENATINATVSCNDGWVYDQSEFVSTVNSDVGNFLLLW
jgi:predicted heme/steroid binding protein